MKDFFVRLSSRKFLLTVGGLILVTMFPDRANDIVTLIGVFVGAEGVADSVSRYAAENTKQKELEKDVVRLEQGGDPDLDVIKDTFVPGDPDLQM